MPCYDPYSDPRRGGLSSVNAQIEAQTARLGARLNEVTALLCALCRDLEQAGWDDSLFDSVHPGLLRWWTAHKAHDAERDGSGRHPAQER